VVASFSQQRLVVSAAVQVVPAQNVVAAAAIFFLPAAQLTPAASHFALSMQHFASVVPTSPHLAESRILLALQVTPAPLHLVATSTQQVALSDAAHALVAQYVVA
jgi:hypothetical protein